MNINSNLLQSEENYINRHHCFFFSSFNKTLSDKYLLAYLKFSNKYYLLHHCFFFSSFNKILPVKSLLARLNLTNKYHLTKLLFSLLAINYATNTWSSTISLCFPLSFPMVSNFYFLSVRSLL